ncbi:unnamed protein product [Phytophthora fragariaefolia]|uniref:Unnamed protein product n=1 Tax=Phytophthora fragariaefolia TaxID=1490495 RepID=A0A9W6YF30_9STRA|nr:unnamed protein product [Phytophthora fragariaefolia]
MTPTEHKTPGPATLLSERETRYLVRAIAKGQLSTKQLKEELKLSTSARTIQRVLAGVDWFVYTKMDNTLPLSAENKRAREAWAWEILMNKDPVRRWVTIIFSDEKKWNLDGPDGFQTYWRDQRRPSRQTKRRQAGEDPSWFGLASAPLARRSWRCCTANRTWTTTSTPYPSSCCRAPTSSTERTSRFSRTGIDSPLQAHAGVLRGDRGLGAAVSGSLVGP